MQAKVYGTGRVLFTTTAAANTEWSGTATVNAGESLVEGFVGGKSSGVTSTGR